MEDHKAAPMLHGLVLFWRSMGAGDVIEAPDRKEQGWPRPHLSPMHHHACCRLHPGLIASMPLRLCGMLGRIKRCASTQGRCTCPNPYP